MKLTILLPLLILSIESYAQKPELQKYYTTVCHAEKSIVHNNFSQAEKEYDTAFRLWQYPFAIDIFNALKCAVQTKNNMSILRYSLSLVELGCDINFFKNPDYLSDFRKSEEWLLFIEQYPSIRMQFVKNNNWQLRSEIEQLRCKDQYLREQDPTREIFTDSTSKVDNRIKYSLLTLFKKKFPNEYDYGIFLDNDTTVAILHPLHTILVHDYNSFDSVVNIDYTPYLINALKLGQMHPDDFGLLNDRSGKFKIGKGFGQDDILVRINKRFYYPAIVDSTKHLIESNRNKYCLCDIADAREKLIYQAKYNKMHFILRKSTANITIYNNMQLSEKQIKAAYYDTGEAL